MASPVPVIDLAAAVGPDAPASALDLVREATETVGQYDVLVSVEGGGIAAQADAVRHGISRALITATETLRPTLRKGGMLTRDPREVERKKYGRHKARKRPQYSKR